MTEGLAAGTRRWIAEEMARSRLSLGEVVRAWGVTRGQALSMLEGSADISTDDLARLARAQGIDAFDLIALVAESSLPDGAQESARAAE